MRKMILLGIVFLITILSVMAQPPFDPSVQTPETGLGILYPNPQSLVLGNNFEFYVHVFNSSNVLLTNDQYNCTIHVYDTYSLEHITRSQFQGNGYLIEKEFAFNYSIINKTGTYEFNLWCNSSNGEWGYLSDFFFVENPPIFTTFNLIMMAFFLIALTYGFLVHKYAFIIAWLTWASILINIVLDYWPIPSPGIRAGVTGCIIMAFIPAVWVINLIIDD